jgi:hypothetical protein
LQAINRSLLRRITAIASLDQFLFVEIKDFHDLSVGTLYLVVFTLMLLLLLLCCCFDVADESCHQK